MNVSATLAAVADELKREVADLLTSLAAESERDFVHAYTPVTVAHLRQRQAQLVALADLLRS